MNVKILDTPTKFKKARFKDLDVGTPFIWVGKSESPNPENYNCGFKINGNNWFNIKDLIIYPCNIPCDLVFVLKCKDVSFEPVLEY